MASVSEETLAQLTATHGRVKVVSYNGHELVFRKPKRAEVRMHAQALDDPQRKAGADEELAQLLIVAYDGVADARKARDAWNDLLDDFPYAASSKPIGGAIAQLTGVVEDIDLKGSGPSSTSSASGPTHTPAA